LDYVSDILDRSFALANSSRLNRSVRQRPTQKEGGRKGRIIVGTLRIDVGHAEGHAIDGRARGLNGDREVGANVYLAVVIGFPVIQVEHRVHLVVGGREGDEDLAAGVFERQVGSARGIDLFASHLDAVAISDYALDLGVGEDISLAQEGIQTIVDGTASLLKSYAGGACEDGQDGGAEIDQRVEGGQIVVVAKTARPQEGSDDVGDQRTQLVGFDELGEGHKEFRGNGVGHLSGIDPRVSGENLLQADQGTKPFSAEVAGRGSAVRNSPLHINVVRGTVAERERDDFIKTATEASKEGNAVDSPRAKAAGISIGGVGENLDANVNPIVNLAGRRGKADGVAAAAGKGCLLEHDGCVASVLKKGRSAHASYASSYDTNVSGFSQSRSCRQDGEEKYGKYLFVHYVLLCVCCLFCVKYK